MIVSLATVAFCSLYLGYAVCDEFCFVLLSTWYIRLANKIRFAYEIIAKQHFYTIHST